MKLFLTFAIALTGLITSPLQPSQAVNLVQVPISTKNNLIAQQLGNVEKILLDLSRPKGSPTKLATMFTANAYQQKGLNFQVGAQSKAAVDFYRQSLTKQGYQEREINAVMGDWGFSMVFDLPEKVVLPPKDASKKAVLVIQGTVLSPTNLNLNLRFEEI